MVEQKRNKRGKELPQTKLTEADVREIRRLHRETTMGQRKLAEQFGVSRQTVVLLLKRETWAWVADDPIFEEVEEATCACERIKPDLVWRDPTRELVVNFMPHCPAHGWLFKEPA